MGLLMHSENTLRSLARDLAQAVKAASWDIAPDVIDTSCVVIAGALTAR